MTMTFDLHLQTHPSEGPNTSSVWIWRKSVQRFPWYFTKKTKCMRQKPNLPQFTACGNCAATMLESIHIFLRQKHLPRHTSIYEKSQDIKDYYETRRDWDTVKMFQTKTVPKRRLSRHITVIQCHNKCLLHLASIRWHGKLLLIHVRCRRTNNLRLMNNNQQELILQVDKKTTQTVA